MILNLFNYIYTRNKHTELELFFHMHYHDVGIDNKKNISQTKRITVGNTKIMFILRFIYYI